MATVQQTLDRGEINALPAACQQVSLGEVLAGLIPAAVERTGLTSQAAHEHSAPGAILSVDDGSAAPLAIIASGSPGAGEVLVEYDSEGLATLTFNAAVTAYSVTMLTLPSGHATALAADNGSGS